MDSHLVAFQLPESPNLNLLKPFLVNFSAFFFFLIEVRFFEVLTAGSKIFNVVKTNKSPRRYFFIFLYFFFVIYSHAKL